MKKTALLLTVLSLALGSLHAQNVPPFMNYQGRVTEAGGVGLGDTTPEARKVVFRLFATTTGGSTLWSEEQTVTLSKGDFSVLLGLGIAFGAEPHDALDTVFTGDRYLEITVDNGDGTINGSDTAILPRQRITSTAYSFRAKTADSVVGGSIGTASLADTSVTLAKMASGSVSSTAIVDGSIGATDLADGSVTLNKLATDSVNSAKIVDGQVALADLAGNSVNSSKIVDATIATADLADASVTKVKLGTDVGVWDTASGNVNRNTGNVGIGTTAPAAKLDLSSSTTAVERLRISGNDDVNSGNINSGISFLLQRNLGNRADFFIGHSPDITRNSTNTGLRIVPGGNPASPQTNGVTVIDAVSTDGSTLKDLGLNFDKIRILGSNGNVGIGIATPPHKLSVHGTTGVTIAVGDQINGGGGTNNPPLLYLRTDNTANVSQIMERSGRDLVFLYTANGGLGSGTEAMRIQNSVSGNVGIAVSNPTQAKLVIGSSVSYTIGTHGVYASGVSNPNNGGGSLGASIYASNNIIGEAFRAFSDERIKHVIGRSDSAADLSALEAIAITDYTHIDTIAKGVGPQKKVIAQQVEKVYPQAVTKSTDVVPDIFKLAVFKDGWIELKTDLKKGDRVRLTDDTIKEVFEVLEVTEGKFRTSFKPAGDKVFVYGREVKDFRTVDYEAISMLNVSATQELARKVEVLEKANAEKDTALTAMTQRLAALEARDKARDAKLAAIEAMLSGDKPAALPVSLKKSVGGAE